ncbi:OadG family protein (plasmid) [Paenibacillus rhizovicinus]|uniref:OadG family protein n=1 Tax=Paenibacillus rhizovicinus TaxID=2704463 RepID=A0A6C0PCF5_9BACL|nr:OadG family protein [Paenibacillus rhizovicinus]QHW35563.1 OadG family protein [Paenibacillus rhizovicinus]
MITVIIVLCLLVLITILLAKLLSSYSYTSKPKKTAYAEQQDAPRIYRKTFDIKTQYSSFSNRSSSSSTNTVAPRENKQNQNSRHSSDTGTATGSTNESFPLNVVLGAAVVSSITTENCHKNDDNPSHTHNHHQYENGHQQNIDSINTPDLTGDGGSNSGSGNSDY